MMSQFRSVFTVFASELRSRVRRPSIPGPQPKKKKSQKKKETTPVLECGFKGVIRCRVFGVWGVGLGLMYGF